MGLADWFSSFSTELIVANTATISYRYQQITQRLNTDFWSTTSETAHSLYVGSYGRNTAISGFSDLDMVFELPFAKFEQYNGYSGNGQSALLQEVRASILKRYPATSIGADGQVVVVKFEDGMRFEVVPVFPITNGFIFPDSNDGGRWRETNPRAEIAALRVRNNSTNGNMIELARMMRAWKNEWSVPIGGLLIDTFVYQFIENYEYRDKKYLYYDFMCRDLFLWMSAQSSTQLHWKAPGSGQWVYGSDFQYKAKRCYNLSLDAITYEQATQHWSAKYTWRTIFGSSYPN